MSWRALSLSALLLLLGGCSTTPPSNPDNLCAIFKQHPDWHEAAVAMQKKWGTPLQIPMAMIYHESGFRDDAEPPMEYFLIIPTGRASSSYGYSQAQDEVWDQYQEERGGSFASRDDFADAIDFIGWYTHKTQKINKVSKWDSYHQYLNYHEGWGGYQRGTYKSKPWLLKLARSVESRASRYGAQYKGCKDDLPSGGWF